MTNNVKDFPAEDLQAFDIEVKSPDDFVVDQINIDDRVVFSCVAEIANARKREPVTVEDVLAELENVGLVRSVAALRTPPTRMQSGTP